MADDTERQSAESPLESTIEAPEPWEPWETRLCLISVALGVAGLAVLGFLVNLYLL